MNGPIGILGGIFDPVHNGHCAAAQLAAEFFGLEKVIYIPSGIPPHKLTSVHATAAHRLAMLTTALGDNTRAVLWQNELQRSGVSYTIDTLDELAETYPQTPMFFIIGADNLHEIHTWHRYQDILRRVTLCVTERPGFSMTVPPELEFATIRTFPSPLWGISSTRIRSLLAEGYSGRYLLPDSVRDYIIKYNLYGPAQRQGARSTD